MTDIQPYTERPIYEHMKQMASNEIPWGPWAVKVLERIETGKKYHLSEMAEICEFEWNIDDPRFQLLFTAAIALGNFYPNPALDVRFYMLHDGEKAFLPKDQMSDLFNKNKANHPVTGAPVPSPQEKFFMIFEAV